jgi:flagellum-specific peptidoglycan hydrolase FlgJ
LVPGKLLCLVLMFYSFLHEDDAIELEYIRAYQELAIAEMHLHRIPASIKLAQALVESDAGRSVLALRANNHFGIKCKSWWTGGQYFYADDDLDNSGKLTASCFRIYDSAQQSFMDHSTFLVSSERYTSLFNYEVSEYRQWAAGLQSCGYATNSRYGKKLIQIIEKYRLYELDQISPKHN